MLLNLPSKKDIYKLKHGASCFYYKVPHEKLGVKFYDTKNERSYAMQMQQLCYYSGIAPKTGEKVDHEGFYGYVTEHVPTLKELYGDWDKVPRKIQNQLDDLVEYIYACCEHEVDCNWLNFGLVNNRLICIDFGFHDRTFYDYYQLEKA